MMIIEQIRPYYPVELHGRSDFLLREYLQHNILQILFTSDYASRFVFIGGTCLRIMHQNRRFSEDLDFDNFGISEQDFTQVSGIIKSGLEKLGYQVEIRNVMPLLYSFSGHLVSGRFESAQGGAYLNQSGYRATGV